MKIEQERIHIRNDKPPAPHGAFVLYWMQASQRAEWNHALTYATAWANDLKKPLLVFFALSESLPGANLRHFTFLLEGLRETRKKLAERGVKLVVLPMAPDEGAIRLAQDAALLVTDRGYLRIEKHWRERVAREVPCAFFEVESNVVIPVAVTSSREAYSARVIRPRIRSLLSRFLVPFEEVLPHIPSLSLPPIPGELDLDHPEAIWSSLRIDTTVPPAQGFLPGTEAAKAKLEAFITEKLPAYAHARHDPGRDVLSRMSPYLHFGQISPLYIAWKVHNAPVPEVHREAYLEELIVRRELAVNFVHYNPHYDAFRSLPLWAQQTLKTHARDPRPYTHSLEAFESAETHDPLWNAAQKELLATGTIHGYVRMYWGKKILEWSKDPEEAFFTALSLNNRYALDGWDPNSFASVAWCFGKHDRPFPERPIYGTVRSMKKGAKSKASEEAYIRKVTEL